MSYFPPREAPPGSPNPARGRPNSQERAHVAKFAKGDRVSQPTYGTGTITETDDSYTVIDFDEHGIRKFLSEKVTLTRSTQPAPPRATGRRKAKSKA
jgi:hypothetical protein